MKRINNYNTFINESIKDYLKPKSIEDIKNSLSQLSRYDLYSKLNEIGKDKLLDIFSKSEYIELISRLNKWERGYINTKVFQYYSSMGMKNWLQGCRHCDQIVPLSNMYKDRQYAGNVYQSLCNCTKCGEYVIFNEDLSNSLEYYIKKNNI